MSRSLDFVSEASSHRQTVTVTCSLLRLRWNQSRHQEARGRASPHAAGGADPTETDMLESIAGWTHDQVMNYLIEAGKFKGQKFSDGVKDKDYTTLVANQSGNLKAIGVKKLVACLHRRQVLSPQARGQSMPTKGSAEDIRRKRRARTARQTPAAIRRRT